MAWSPGVGYPRADYPGMDYREVDYREVGARRQAADGLMLRPVGSATRVAGRGEDIAAVVDHAAAADIVVALRMAVEEVAARMGAGVDMREAVALEAVVEEVATPEAEVVAVVAAAIISNVSQLLWAIDEISSG